LLDFIPPKTSREVGAKVFHAMLAGILSLDVFLVVVVFDGETHVLVPFSVEAR
jgi:hypothetical protein